MKKEERAAIREAMKDLLDRKLSKARLKALSLEKRAVNGAQTRLKRPFGDKLAGEALAYAQEYLREIEEGWKDS